MPALSESGVAITRKAIDFIEGDITIRPLGDRIVVKPLPVLLSSIIHAAWVGRTERGVVIASGPGEYPNVYNADRSTVRRSSHFRPNEVRVGDIVHLGGMEIGGYDFPTVRINGQDVVIASEKDVCGIEDPSWLPRLAPQGRDPDVRWADWADAAG